MVKKFQYLDPEEILDSDDFRVIESFLKETGRTQIGWHYIVDLTWMYSWVKTWPISFKVLDVGGGHGPIQFLLAELGFDVTNIDLEPARIRYIYQQRYKTQLHRLNSYQATEYSDHLKGLRRYRAIAKKLYASINEFPVLRDILYSRYFNKHQNWRAKYVEASRPVGTIEWVMGNICSIPEIQEESFDAIVSLSSIEHIPKDYLNDALQEISRVLKPGARYAITTSATHLTETWFHEPSRGLCFSEFEIPDIFDAEKFNDVDPEKILEKYQKSEFLKKNLAGFYKKSGANGMPWGEWEPKYIPVGIFN